MRRWRFLGTLGLACWLGTLGATFTPGDAHAAANTEPFYPGAYGSTDGPLFVVTRWGDDHYLLDMRGGRANRLEPLGDHRFVYGPTRSSTEPVTGEVRFEVDDSGEIGGLFTAPDSRLARIPLQLEEVEFTNGDEAQLAGTMVRPPGPVHAWILYLAGEGPNPRWDSFDVAAWLGAHGIGTLLIDQRGAGDSTGEEVTGNYHQRSLAAASDAAAAMRFLRLHPHTNGRPVGIGGHSQGGWIGAIVAREVPATDFYINTAGNGSGGYGQWRHAMTTWLHRKQVPLGHMAAAATYFDAFFGVYDGELGWDAYAAARDRARDEPWWPVMKQRYFAEWESLEEAREFAAAEAGFDPADDFRQVRVPALGLFFEHDHSTTPETPHVFLRALVEGGNGDVTVRVFPRGDHGGWVVDGYRMDRSQITHRLTAHLELMRDWILEIR